MSLISDNFKQPTKMTPEEKKSPLAMEKVSSLESELTDLAIQLFSLTQDMVNTKLKLESAAKVTYLVFLFSKSNQFS